jgi:hypothetical protein
VFQFLMGLNNSYCLIASGTSSSSSMSTSTSVGTSLEGHCLGESQIVEWTQKRFHILMRKHSESA